jgi:hypothetical protein
MSDAADTRGSSIITDHPFQPRMDEVTLRHPYLLPLSVPLTPEEMHTTAMLILPPNPYLCEVCRLAEAAHLPREEKP